MVKKRILCLFILLGVGMLLWGCQGQENDKKEADAGVGLSMEGEKALSPWQWGPEAELSIEETDDKRVIVKNSDGQEVLDVTDYEKTDILFDEKTGACRCIKTYTRDGEKMKEGEGRSEYEVYLYKYNYYDTTGAVLEEKSDYDIRSIIGNMAFSIYQTDYQRLINLANGEILISDEYLECWISDGGFVASDSSNSGFWSEEGKKLGSIDRVVSPVQTIEDIWSISSMGNWYCTSQKTLSYGSAPLSGADDGSGDVTYSSPKEEEIVEAIDSLNTDLSGYSYFTYQNELEDPFVLVDSAGNVVLEPTDMEKYGILDNGDIVAYKGTTTEVLAADSLEPVKTLDFHSIYYDGENAIKQTQVRYNYLTDGEGEVLSQCYEELMPINAIDEVEKYFYGQQWNSWYGDIIDQKGQVLFTNEYEGVFYYVGEGIFYCSGSNAGNYLLDSSGKVTEVFSLEEGYEYDQKAGEIVKK